ncbi:CocE/NonD family hydrolase [Aspergillus brunneoviolaceus CBS 621.78]|uniref:Alpha/beta-hydrolase n=1 Tax=Aspergillus brunneoviolaceus CBS 621.78 TaxID=1450534 RepID=A0ACD1GFR1_9EURO|nr:alpha/beta-hydrolase [Aspergillus brunneoviolaceus CBS 621.78]RAH48129.1 alpha/beta-hydrolase [Aspergillus brunneoviolaceus CBS 621.78]
MTTTEKSIRAAFPDLEWHKLTPPTDHPTFTYYGFQPSETILPKGHVRSSGFRSLPTDMIYGRDVAITLRDGIKIYADIFRPVDSDDVPVPAIMPWSPYGKTGTGPQSYDSMAPFRAGLEKGRTSGYEKFEGPDPAEWTARGYAVVNVDARGCGDSEGNIVFWGQQEAEDIWDAIDWLARQPWCSGSVGMAGNSWLSIAQVNFASRFAHPALKALAPWEGLTDLYRDLVFRGGRPHNERFHAMILTGFAGHGAAENMPAMIRKRPFYDDYWQSKRIHPERIGDVPLYVLASYSSMLHTRGSFETFRAAQSPRKWLRVHPYQEWYDLYRPEMVEDLARYFDRYLKGVENGWEESTPPVRLSLLGFEDSVVQTICERPEKEYPLARQELKRFYLRPETMTLQPQQPVAVSSVAHAGHDLKASSDFVLYFDQYTELAGYPQVRLWMSCPDHDDLDVAVQIRKINRDGKLLEHLNYPCPMPATEVPNVNTVKTLGPSGFLRASHAVTRDDDETRSTADEIMYRHDRREPIAPGTIVPLDIGLWPMGMVFGPGEGIVLRVSGHDMCFPEVDFMRPTEPDDENQGAHVVYGGGEYASHLVLPFV